MIRIRKIRSHACCHRCGHAIGKDEYGREVAIVVYITLCGDCAYDDRERLFALPESVNLGQSRSITSDVMKALTREEK